MSFENLSVCPEAFLRKLMTESQIFAAPENLES